MPVPTPISPTVGPAEEVSVFSGQGVGLQRSGCRFGAAYAASRILSGFEQIRGSQGFLSNFWDSCRSVWLLLLVMFFLGFFALGVPVLFAVPFWKGMGMGYLIGYLYMTFSWEGAGYAALIIVLPCCFFIPFFFYGWKESLFSAGSLFRYCWGESVHSQIENEKRSVDS